MSKVVFKKLINNEQFMNKKLKFYHFYANWALRRRKISSISVSEAHWRMKNAYNWYKVFIMFDFVHKVWKIFTLDAQSALTMESLSVQNNLQEAIYHYDFWPWDNILSCYVGENLSSFRWHLHPIVWSKNI